MAATYGRMAGDSTKSVTRSGSRYTEATLQTERIRANVTVWLDDRVEIELRVTDDRHDSGRIIGHVTMYPAAALTESDTARLLVNTDRELLPVTVE